MKKCCNTCYWASDHFEYGDWMGCGCMHPEDDSDDDYNRPDHCCELWLSRIEEFARIEKLRDET